MLEVQQETIGQAALDPVEAPRSPARCPALLDERVQKGSLGTGLPSPSVVPRRAVLGKPRKRHEVEVRRTRLPCVAETEERARAAAPSFPPRDFLEMKRRAKRPWCDFPGMRRQAKRHPSQGQEVTLSPCIACLPWTLRFSVHAE